MAEDPIFPINKRHAMIFWRRSPEATVTAFPSSSSDHLSPRKASDTSYHTPATIEEALALSETPPRPPPHKDYSHSRHFPQRYQPSEHSTDVRVSPWPKEPRSRKTNSTIIHTDATETHPAFESDAFAIEMPATREPIIDTPVPRPKLPSPLRAQVEAYHTYRQKAQQMRERNTGEGIRIPSKVDSYDYTQHVHARSLDHDPNPPNSPSQLSPAGSFPASPPLAQHTWQHPRQTPRSFSATSAMSIARKPVGLGDGAASARPRLPRGDAQTGAASPHKIKVRLKPRPAPADSSQKESWWALNARATAPPSSDASRSSSPEKSPATPGVAAVFGFAPEDITGTPARSEPKARTESPPKRSLTSRWGWLRPAGPHVAKPAATSPSTASLSSNSHGPAVTAAPMAYIDPFLLHSTPLPSPLPSRPSSPPRKLARTALAPPPPQRTFETGFAQVQSVGALILKVCIIVYALVAVYFVLDAVREAVHALGAPVRGVRVVGWYVWTVGKVVGRWARVGWERWGVRVVFRGRWRGGW